MCTAIWLPGLAITMAKVRSVRVPSMAERYVSGFLPTSSLSLGLGRFHTFQYLWHRGLSLWLFEIRQLLSSNYKYNTRVGIKVKKRCPFFTLVKHLVLQFGRYCSCPKIDMDTNNSAVASSGQSSLLRFLATIVGAYDLFGRPQESSSSSLVSEIYPPLSCQVTWRLLSFLDLVNRLQ
jgi:hypothetical protein